MAIRELKVCLLGVSGKNFLSILLLGYLKIQRMNKNAWFVLLYRLINALKVS